jgi:hypothetical protein
LSFGCAVVASRTGWLQRRKQSPLIVIDRHDPDIYPLCHAERRVTSVNGDGAADRTDSEV